MFKSYRDFFENRFKRLEMIVIKSIRYHTDDTVYFLNEQDESFECFNFQELIMEASDCGFALIDAILEQSSGFISIAVASREADLITILSDYFDSYPKDYKKYVQPLNLA